MCVCACVLYTPFCLCVCVGLLCGPCAAYMTDRGWHTPWHADGMGRGKRCGLLGKCRLVVFDRAGLSKSQIRTQPMQHARCALADTSAVGFLVRRPPTNRDGDALTGRRLLVRPGARFDSAKPVLSNKEVHTPSCEGSSSY